MRVLAVDPGTKRIGVALCDELEITIRSVCTLPSRGMKRDARTISRMADELGAERIVLGLPLTVNGSYGEAAFRVLKLAEEIQSVSHLQVITWDERFTSVAATAFLKAHGERITQGRVDQIAACIILEDYLKNHGHQEHPSPDNFRENTQSSAKSFTGSK